MQSVKNIIDRTVPAGVLLFKLMKGEKMVWPGLNTCNRIFELNHKTLNVLNLLFRMNFSSVLIIKSMAGNISPEKIVFLVQLAKYAASSAKQSVNFWKDAAENQIQQELLLHSEMSLKFFKLVAYYAIVRCNLYEKDGLMVKKKNFNQIVYENFLLSEEINKLANELSSTQIDSKMNICFSENKVFVPEFVKFYCNYYTTEAIKQYGFLKDSIEAQNMNTAEEILDYVACTSDFVEKVFEKSS